MACIYLLNSHGGPRCLDFVITIYSYPLLIALITLFLLIFLIALIALIALIDLKSLMLLMTLACLIALSAMIALITLIALIALFPRPNYFYCCESLGRPCFPDGFDLKRISR